MLMIYMLRPISSTYQKVVAMHTWSSDWKCVVITVIIIDISSIEDLLRAAGTGTSAFLTYM
jgi:hypothetical protein